MLAGIVWLRFRMDVWLVATPNFTDLALSIIVSPADIVPGSDTILEMAVWTIFVGLKLSSRQPLSVCLMLLPSGSLSDSSMSLCSNPFLEATAFRAKLRNVFRVLMICAAFRNRMRGIRASATAHLRTFPQVRKRPRPPTHIRIARITICGDSENINIFMRETESRCNSAGRRLVVVR